MKINNNVTLSPQIRGNDKGSGVQEREIKDKVTIGQNAETPDFLKIKQGSLKSSLNQSTKVTAGLIGITTLSAVAGNLGSSMGHVGLAAGLMGTAAAVAGGKYLDAPATCGGLAVGVTAGVGIGGGVMGGVVCGGVGVMLGMCLDYIMNDVKKEHSGS